MALFILLCISPHSFIHILNAVFIWFILLLSGNATIFHSIPLFVVSHFALASANSLAVMLGCIVSRILARLLSSSTFDHCSILDHHHATILSADCIAFLAAAFLHTHSSLHAHLMIFPATGIAPPITHAVVALSPYSAHDALL